MRYIPTLYSDYTQLLLDIKIYGQLVSVGQPSLSELKDIYELEFRQRKPLCTMEDSRHKLSNIVSDDYRIAYNKALELRDNETEVDLTKDRSSGEPYVEDTELIVAEGIQVLFSYENQVTNSERDQLLEQYDLESGELFEPGIKTMEEKFGTTKSREDLVLSEEEIADLGKTSDEDEFFDDEDELDLDFDESTSSEINEDYALPSRDSPVNDIKQTEGGTSSIDVSELKDRSLWEQKYSSEKTAYTPISLEEDSKDEEDEDYDEDTFDEEDGDYDEDVDEATEDGDYDEDSEDFDEDIEDEDFDEDTEDEDFDEDIEDEDFDEDIEDEDFNEDIEDEDSDKDTEDTDSDKDVNSVDEDVYNNSSDNKDSTIAVNVTKPQVDTSEEYDEDFDEDSDEDYDEDLDEDYDEDLEEDYDEDLEEDYDEDLDDEDIEDESEDDYDEDIDEEEIPQEDKISHSKPVSASNSSVQNTSVTQQNIQNTSVETSRTANFDIPDDVDLSDSFVDDFGLSDDDFLPSGQDKPRVVEKIKEPPQKVSSVEPVQNVEPKNEVKEQEPTDLRQFLRKHPRCTMEFALEHFTKKQINDAIKIGKIVKRGNILKL